MFIAYGGVDGDSEQGFGLIIKGPGQDHLPTVGEINPEVLCIRLKDTHQNINNSSFFDGVFPFVWRVELTDAWSIE